MSVIPAQVPRKIVRPRVSRARGLLEREGMLAYLFMVPGAIVLILFMAYPFGLGIYLSLTDKLVGFADFSYVGLENYRYLLTDSIFRQTVENTFVYSFFTVPFKLVLGLGLALVLNQSFRFSRVLRAGLLLPWIVPTAISSLAWLMLFDSVLSPISWVLRDWNLADSNINFLGSRINAMASLCLANVWRGVPFFGVSILAGLQAVPQELNEAAALDGANAWQRFKAVTWPVIRNIVLISTLFSIIWTFSDFQLIYVLTKGGPANSTHVFGTYAYGAMGFGDLGQAASIALYMFPILAVFAVILLRYVRAEE
ncbi:MAG: sugar ABC transporter permease [Chloroflexota bacterium]|nr:sugar ABC transporter permease [Chloroflexota bacterium]